MEVKYSFIVPVYNVEKYISKCIDSLLAQTYRLFEIVIVDDGSPDASGNIADSYQSKYPGIVKVIHQKNTGQGGARNHGIDLAQGEYILFVDGDDFVVPNMLEIIDTYTGKYNNDLLFFQWETIEEKKLVECADAAYLGDYSTMSLVEYVYQQPSPCRKVYKASIFRNKQLRFPSRIFYEDLSLAPCLVSEVKSIGVIQEKLYFYVQHKSSTMHSKDVNRILDILSAFDFIMSYYKDNNLLDKYHSEIEWLAIQHVLYYSCCRISFIECNATAAEQLISYMNTNFPEYKNNKYIDTPNECVIREEIDALINNGYIAFDKCYYSKKRIVNRIKSVIKKIFVNCNNKLNTYQAEIR